MKIANSVESLDTFGILVDDEEMYSATLRKIVMRCLALKATDRPTPDELLEICESATAVVNKMEDEEVHKIEAKGLPHQFWDPDLIARMKPKV